MSELKLSPLYKIFESHLYDFNDETDTETEFVGKVVNDYIKFLDHTGAVVPPKMRALVIEELTDQVKKMLMKKMYGCLTLKEFLESEKAKAGKQKSKKSNEGDAKSNTEEKKQPYTTLFSRRKAG